MKLPVRANLKLSSFVLMLFFAAACSSDPEPRGNVPGGGGTKTDVEDGDGWMESDAGEDSEAEPHFLQIEISSGPTGLTRETQAVFEFGCNLAICDLSCALDGGAEQPCASPVTFEGLEDGAHMLEVSGIDAETQVRVTARRAWRVDTTPPQVVELAGPGLRTNATTAQMMFACSEEGCSYVCRLDDGAFEACAPGVRYEGLADGTHQFEVRATDEAGNEGEIEGWSWTVDTVVPVVEDLNGPAEATRQRGATFEFACSKEECRFTCELTGETRGVVRSSRACSSGVNFTNLTDDVYTFTVFATDDVGNRSAVEAWTWRVDNQAPTVEISSGPENPSMSREATFELGCSEEACTFLCTLTSATQGTVEAESVCASGVRYEDLADDDYLFSVVGRDAAGNQGASVSWAWRVDGAAPVVSFEGGPAGQTFEDFANFEIVCADESPCGVVCDLGYDDGAGEIRLDLWENCDGLYGLDGLEPGQYTLYAKGVDGAGNEGFAEYGWEVLGNEWSVLSSGGAHGCGIRPDGSLWCWGDNENGQLGTGDTERRVWPTRVGTADDWTVVVGGKSHTCGLRSGELWCWGNNRSGQLGLEVITQRLSPTRIGGSAEWNDLSAGDAHTCGLRSGYLWCWGSNADGQLGLGYAGGEVVPTRVGVSRDWTEVSAGGAHTCGLRSGELWCWGKNDFSQLGQGDFTRRTSPTRVGTSQQWTRVSAGKAHGCGIDGGSLWCWGDNRQGQTGRGALPPSEPDAPYDHEPAQVGSATDWSDVSCGLSHSCGVRDGSMWCWGDNREGKLGLGDVSLRTAPAQVEGSGDWSEVFVGDDFSCGLEAGRGWCWGSNGLGQLAMGSYGEGKYAPVAVESGPSFVELVSGQSQSCGIGQDGSLWCWGDNAHGQLGLGDRVYRIVPTRVGEATGWSQVSIGSAHACGVLNGALWCWGGNAEGQLGLDDRVDRLVPTQVGAAADWTMVAAGARHGCGLRGGSLWCWGDNEQGQLGVGDLQVREVPTRVGDGQSFSAVVAGGAHSCGLEAGMVFCWGANDAGQLGLGDTNRRETPARVGLAADWDGLAAGARHGCGLRGGSLWCWGANGSGQLGLGYTSPEESAPTRVGTAADWRAVGGGGAHSCAVRGADRLWCWGANGAGQLGVGSVSTLASGPQPVGTATDWSAPAPGGEHSCALRAGGAWCWGRHEGGRLGDGTVGRLVPGEIGRRQGKSAPLLR